MSTAAQYIAVVAPKYGLPIQLVTAIVQVESGGDRFAWNPEPKYRYLWDVARHKAFRKLTAIEEVSEVPPKDFPTMAGDRDAEWWGQQASWGLMQAMGGVARELGFDGHFPGLSDPLVNLNIGCRHLQRLIKRYKAEHGIWGAVAAYNAGSPRMNGSGAFVNQIYVDKVTREGGFIGVS